MTNYNGSMAMDANYIYVQVANIQNTVHYIYKFDFNLIRDTSFYPYTGGGANDARNGNQMVVSEGYIYHRAGKFSISSNTAIYNYTPKSGLCLGENSEILIIQDSGYIGKLNKSTGGNIYLNNTNTSPEFAVIAYDPPNKRFLVGGRYTTKNMFEELKIKE
jgi:hypothetical protein